MGLESGLDKPQGLTDEQWEKITALDCNVAYQKLSPSLQEHVVSCLTNPKVVGALDASRDMEESPLESPVGMGVPKIPVSMPNGQGTVVVGLEELARWGQNPFNRQEVDWNSLSVPGAFQAMLSQSASDSAPLSAESDNEAQDVEEIENQLAHKLTHQYRKPVSGAFQAMLSGEDKPLEAQSEELYLEIEKQVQKQLKIEPNQNLTEEEKGRYHGMISGILRKAIHEMALFSDSQVLKDHETVREKIRQWPRTIIPEQQGFLAPVQSSLLDSLNSARSEVQPGVISHHTANRVVDTLVDMQRRALKKDHNTIQFSQKDVRRQGKMLAIGKVANQIQQLQVQAQLTPDVCKATLNELIKEPAIKGSWHIPRECRRLIKEIDRLEADKAHYVGAHQDAPQPEEAVRIGV